MIHDDFSLASRRNTAALAVRFLHTLLTVWLGAVRSIGLKITRHLLCGEFACLLPPRRVVLNVGLTALHVFTNFQPPELLPEYAMRMQTSASATRCHPSPARAASPPAKEAAPFPVHLVDLWATITPTSTPVAVGLTAHGSGLQTPFDACAGMVAWPRPGSASRFGYVSLKCAGCRRQTRPSNSKDHCLRLARRASRRPTSWHSQTHHDRSRQCREQKTKALVDNPG